MLPMPIPDDHIVSHNVLLIVDDHIIVPADAVC